MPGTRKDKLELSTKGLEPALLLLAAFPKEIEYSVWAGLRRAAQSTRTETTREMARNTSLVQRVWRNRIHTYGDRRGGLRNWHFKCWFGMGRWLRAEEDPAIEGLARARGYFKATVHGTTSYWRRRGKTRVPLERFKVVPREEGAEPTLVKHFNAGVRTVYRQRVRREVRTRLKRRLRTGLKRFARRSRRSMLASIIPRGRFF